MVEKSMMPVDGTPGYPVETKYEGEVDRVPVERGAAMTNPADEAIPPRGRTSETFDMTPRSLMDESRNGGYAQEWDQSFPASGPRPTAGTRGANDSRVTTGKLTITDVPSKEK